MFRFSQNLSKRLSRKKSSKAAEKQFNEVKKILLLGTGESGKTTIIKQMKILHINGFSERELKGHIPDIRANLHESIFAILDSMDKISPPIEVEYENSKHSVEYILELGINYSTFDPEYFDHLQQLASDPGIWKALKRSNEFQLLDCAEYFLGRIKEIRRNDYLPNTQDILFCRIKTTSINKIEFTITNDKKFGSSHPKFWMYDVGGQRGERRKWIQVFEGIDAILFLIAASEFDQHLREDPTKNRFQESLTLFGDIYGSRFLRTAGLIVFLNKQDLLKKKIKEGKKLQDYFPEYKTYDNKERKSYFNDEYEKAKSFMKDKILELVQPLSVEHVGFIPGKFIHEIIPKRDVYIHYTVATDTRNIKTVFDCVQEIVLRQTIHELF
ncbi:guanine nucleotide-binding protein G(f) subunit alpha [Coccinella septempunctata]|uniref:guanine nucleotide-binding protein G(f) subunit alpha n=1 Tax=Coccinella septempunctata TaxID=41139 RepID=UPI001D08D147|nr:guanine nucleotide-binding protein G(f) subunit alpha [Coccinella septempunctata]